MQGLGSGTGWFDALSRPAWCAKSAESSQWRDSRHSKPTPWNSDFKQKESNVAVWLNNRQKPARVDSQLATFDSGMTPTPEFVSISIEGHGVVAAHKVHLQIGMCRKLCEDGRIADAVHALDVLVQQKCHVPNNLFYRVLKRCIKDKDLVLGRHIHALTVESGYEGDAFLATHLIGLYASHGRLQEAMRVFTRVSEPDAYNWATIILAYARHGEAAKAIRLYQVMCESTSIKPDDRTYSAVLKACADAGDLVTGKEVHARIRASRGKPDSFVQAGLVNMYAKCGSLEEARRLLDNLPERSVVAWNAMIAGHVQQGMGQEAFNLYSSMQQEGVTPNSVTYACLLQACASVGIGALIEGKQLHAKIKLVGLQDDGIIGVSLINMYAKCGSLVDARIVFHKLRDRDVVAWNAMIAGYAQQGMGREALCLYSSMQQEGHTVPNSVTYVCLLQACAILGVGALDEGKQLHAQIREQGLQVDVVLGGSLINMYAKCGSLENARQLFDRLPKRNVVTWNAMLAGYAQQDRGQEALSLYSSMQQEGLTPPDCVTYVCLLQACASVGVGALREGKQLHAHIKEQGLEEDVVLGGSLVNMYAKCGSLEDARIVFDELPKRNVVAWTAMLAGYVQQGMGQAALTLYRTMQQEGLALPDLVTYACLLQACASEGVGALYEGQKLHAQIQTQGLQEDLVLGGCLVNMYAKCGSLEDARTVFDKLADRDIVTWTAMLAGYVQQGMGQQALGLYRRMQQEGLTTPNTVTYLCLLQACASVGVGALHDGRQLHAQIKEQGLQDVVLGSSLVNMYVKCGCLEEARTVFDKLPDRNVVACNAMLGGYAQQGMGQEALSLYSSMHQEGLTRPDSVTYVCLLQACASVGVASLHEGQQLHAQIRKQGRHEEVVLGGSLVNMYARCGSLDDSRRVFDRLPDKNVVTWNAMITGYVQQGMGQEALSLYSSMQWEGIDPDPVTYVCLLQACASIGVGSLHEGKQLHDQIKERGLQQELVLGGSLVNMYARCGSLEDAHRLFDKLPERNAVTWNVMIAGYAQQGMGLKALSLYGSMQQEDPTLPDAVTYVCLLHACGDVGALPLGEQLHAVIVEQDMQHDGVVGAALVDMYAKCGSMYDSQQVFDSLPQRSVEAWGALISGYARKGDRAGVFDLLDRMRLEGIQPDGMTFLSVLTVCSHAGLVDKGQEYFENMRADYGISASVEHFRCMVDLLARAGHLDEALQIAKTMPFQTDDVVWHTLLGACQKWNNVEIGLEAFRGAVREDDRDGASYVLMSNIYASIQMWEAATEMQARRKKLGAWKKPGQSWLTDMGGVVHTFLAGDNEHPDIE